MTKVVNVEDLVEIKNGLRDSTIPLYKFDKAGDQNRGDYYCKVFQLQFSDTYQYYQYNFIIRSLHGGTGLLTMWVGRNGDDSGTFDIRYFGPSIGMVNIRAFYKEDNHLLTFRFNMKDWSGFSVQPIGNDPYQFSQISWGNGNEFTTSFSNYGSEQTIASAVSDKDTQSLTTVTDINELWNN